MKKLLPISAVLCLLLAMMACNGSKKNDPNAFDVNTITVEDSVQFPPEALEEWMFDDKATYLAVVDEPLTKNEDLRDNIVGWISEFLSPNYDGDSQDVAAMVDFEKNEFLGLETGSPQSQLQHFITLQEDNDRYVTYISDSYLFTGGAHGTSSIVGATFLKTTGERFTYDMFLNPMALTGVIKDGVEAQYFAPMLEGTDVDFKTALLVEDFDEFPLPINEPWIQNDSVFFIYSAYEISPYAMGMPKCGFPCQSMMEYLTDAGKAFFK